MDKIKWLNRLMIFIAILVVIFCTKLSLDVAGGLLILALLIRAVLRLLRRLWPFILILIMFMIFH